MSITRAGNTRDDLVGQLDEVWSSLLQLGSSLEADEWHRPTPCPGWDVAAQYAHVIGTESMLLGRPNPEVEAPDETPGHVRNSIGTFNEVWVEYLARRSSSELLDTFSEVVTARREALAGMTEEDFAAESWTPVGQADYRRFMQIRVFDCYVHELDVRAATDRAGHQSGPVAEQSVDEVVRALGFIVGKKAAAPQGSAVRFELTDGVTRRIDVDVSARATVVEELDRPPTATLELASGLFLALACGRTSPAQSEGRVSTSGDADLARRVVENLAFTV